MGKKSRRDESVGELMVKEAPATDGPIWQDAEHERRGEALAAAWRSGDAEAIAAAAAALREGVEPRAGEFLGQGRFRLLDKRGQDALTAVWRAEDRERGGHVAIQLLHAHWAADPGRVQRFFDAAARMAALPHPNLVPIVQPRGEDAGFVWFATGWPTGGSLEQAVLARGLTRAEGLQALLDAVDALAHAHAHGLLHRSLSPSDVLLWPDGLARVGHFDLLVEERRGAGAIGSVYMAPEAMDPTHEPGPPDDVYALGMTALFLLHGSALPYWILRDPERLLVALDASESVRDALRTAIDWDPDARFATVDELREALLDDASLVDDLARSALAKGRRDAAAAHIRRRLAMVPPPEDAHRLQVELARLLAASGDPAEAAEALLIALGEAQDFDTAQAIVADLRELADRSGDREPLVRALNLRVEAAGPDRVACLIELAGLSEARGDEPDWIRATWELVLEHHSSRDEARQALRALIRLADLAGDVEGVVRTSRELVPLLDPQERAAAQYAIGRAYLDRLSDQQNGLLWLERALQGGYEDPGLAAELEAIRSARGEWRHVVAIMREQARQQPTPEAIETLLRAADIALHGHREEREAAELHEAVLALDPQRIESIRFLARWSLRQGRPVDARSRLEQLLSLPAEPPLEAAADALALAELLTDAPDRARAALERAVAANPALLRAWEMLVRLRLATGDLAGAREAAERVHAVHAGLGSASAPSLCELAEIAWLEGDLARASALYQQVLEADPEHTGAWWGAARVALVAPEGLPAWATTAPTRFTPQEALARLLAALLEPDAMRAWLATDPIGERLVSGDAARLPLWTVDQLERLGLAGPDLFVQLAQAFDDWAGPIEAVRRLWCEPLDEDRFSVAESYAWSALGAFDPGHHRDPVHASPPRTGDCRTADLSALLRRATAAPPPPTASTESAPAPRPAPERRRGAVLVAETGVVPLEGDVLELGEATLLRAGRWFYVTAPSGLAVDGQQVTEARLLGGEAVRIDGVAYRFDLFDPDAEPPKAATREATPIEPAIELPEEPAVERPAAALFFRDDNGFDRMVGFTRDEIAIGRRAADDIELDGPGRLRIRFHEGEFFASTDGAEDQAAASGDRFVVGGRTFELRLLDDEPGEVEVEVAPEPSPRGMLLYYDGSPGGQRIELESSPFTIGRGRDNSLQIGIDPQLSRHHCRIERRGDRWFVVDARSSGGTRVNAERITEVELEDGDLIEIGETRIEFELIEPLGLEIEQEEEEVTDTASCVPLKRPGAEGLTVTEGLEKIAIANAALAVILRAYDAAGGAGRGEAELQLMIDGAPRNFAQLFDGVRVGPRGLPAMHTLYNAVRRPEPEQRRILCGGLLDLIDRAVSVACDTLPGPAVDDLLEAIVRVSYRDHLRMAPLA